MIKRLVFFVSAWVILTFQTGAGQSVWSPQEKESGFNCFTILVGKNATDQGCVYMAHNEDDYGPQLVNWIIEPGKHYPEGIELELKNGGKLAQVETTNRFIWLEMPGMDFSDSYLNEYGVCIASNSCPSREDHPEITDGGIGYRLRGLMAERATSARDAVRIAGTLIEQFGYTGSGRTYSVADPNEAWAISVVRGKHWVAHRVPDDEVMVLPNNYMITNVDLSDTENFMGSKDLIKYAIQRGWYDPDRDGDFNFRKAYASTGSMKHPANINRAWGAYYLFDAGIKINGNYPFSFKPKKKVSKEKLMQVLSSHYEGTPLDKSKGYTLGSPYKLNGSMICGKASVYSFVAELRNWMPADIGCVLWLAPQWSDIQPFIPWYAGTVSVPSAFARPDYPKSFKDHYHPPKDIRTPNDRHAFWTFVAFSDYMNRHYGEKIEAVKKYRNKIEKTLLKKQKKIERKALKKYQKDPESARTFLTGYTDKLAEFTYKYTAKQINK